MKVWHRRLGLVSAVFVLLLAVTGFLLNHTSDWSLEDKILNSPMLLGWYGVESDIDSPSFKAADIWFTQVDSDLYLDTNKLLSCYGELRGAISIASNLLQAQDSSTERPAQQNGGQQVAIACSKELIMVTPDGVLLERIGVAQGLPGHVERLGKTTPEDATETLLLAADTGIYLADPEALDWRSVASDKMASKVVQWSDPATLPEEIQATLSRGGVERGITLERLLLDIHSGRILGLWGVYLIDLMAFLFVFIAITGLVMWLRAENHGPD